MSWKEVLKQEKHIDYLHSKLKPIMGDLTDETVREFQSKFSDKQLKAWHWAELNQDEWWLEPTTDKGIKMLNNWRTVEDWFKQYGRN